MTTGTGTTIRSEEERNAVFHLRAAMLWRVKVQLQATPAVTAQQFQEMVRIAVWDAQALATEIANLYPAMEALQKVGWRAIDAFDRSLPPPPGAPQPAAQAYAGPVPGAPPGAPQNRPASELDNFGRDLDKGFKDLGGAIDGLFSGKKKP